MDDPHWISRVRTSSRLPARWLRRRRTARLRPGVPPAFPAHASHAIQQTFFLYVLEPGGNRIELCNAGARLILAPDWQTVEWTTDDRSKGQAWGLKTVESFHTYGTPIVDYVAPTTK